MPWLGNVMALMVAIGVLGQVTVVASEPSTGLLAVCKAFYLPKILLKTNAHGISIPILLMQAIVVTFLCLIFLVMPSVLSVFQILSQISNIMFLTMYTVMFVAAIALRYTQPYIARPFRIPGCYFGMFIVVFVGLAGALIAVALSFAPPNQIGTGSAVIYVGILLAGTAIEVAIPFVIFAFRKKTWKAYDSDFEPFEAQAKDPEPVEQAS